MAALTVVYVVLAFREDSSTRLDDYALWGLSVVFLAEFGARCYDCRNRGTYLRTHWLDLITAIPAPGVPGLRVIRLLRLLRVMKLGIYVRRALGARGWGETGLLWPTLVLFWVASALALWLVEHDAPGSVITSFGEAMGAAFLTASTLGFGKHAVPVTQDGQFIAALIVFFALGLWGFASSRLTQMWLQGRKEEAGEYAQIHHDLAAIDQQLKHLTAAVAEANIAGANLSKLPGNAALLT
jgi:voltage-gated potassium channel